MASKNDIREETVVQAGPVTYTAPVTSPPKPLFTTPIVLKLEKTKKGKKKKKYTRGSKNLQQLVLGVAEAASRTSNSLTKGLRTFVRRTKKSQRKRRDGLIRDSLLNASRGAREGFTELGKAPGDVAKRINTRRAWRTIRILTPGVR